MKRHGKRPAGFLRWSWCGWHSYNHYDKNNLATNERLDLFVRHAIQHAHQKGTGLPDFVAIAAGGSHSLALHVDGSITSWGWNSHGQVSGTPTGTGFVAISAGTHFSLAIAADGSIVGWARTTRRRNLRKNSAGNDFVGISAVDTMALRSKRMVQLWLGGITVTAKPLQPLKATTMSRFWQVNGTVWP